MPLIPEPSSSESVAVGAAAVAFATVMVAGKFYEFSSTTACWIARAESLAFADATFIADNATETLTFDAPHGLLTGDGPLRLTNSGEVDALPAGLTAVTDYWVIGVDADTFKLATSLANAQAGTAVDLTTAGVGTQTLSDTVDTLDVTPLVYADVTFNTSFAGNTATLPGHGLLTGDGPFRVSNSGGALPGGLLADTDYWVRKSTNNSFSFAVSYADAIAATIIDIIDDGSGTHTISDTATTVRRAALVYADATFTANATANTLAIAAHGLSTGDGPFQVSNSGVTDALPTGLSAGTDYWAIVTAADTIQLATSYANAIAETEVTFTDDGYGVHTMSDTTRTIAAGTGAAAGAGTGSMPVGAGERVTLMGSVTVDSAIRARVSVVRNAADGFAGLTLLAEV